MNLFGTVSLFHTKFIRAVAILSGISIGTAQAQEQASGTRSDRGFFVIPGSSVFGAYDDNIFYQETDQEAVFFTRFIQRIEVGYRGTPLTLSGSYSFDSEIFPDHVSRQTELFARQHASVAFSSLVTRHATFSLNAEYLNTRRTSEVLEETGLDMGRQRIESYTADVRFTHQFSQRNTWEANYLLSLYDLSQNEVEPTGLSGQNTSHSLSTRWIHQRSGRGTIQFQYLYRLFVDDAVAREFGYSSASNSHVVTFGVTRQLSSRTSITLRVGPRFSGRPTAVGTAEDVEHGAEPIEHNVQASGLATQSSLTAEAAAGIRFGWNRSELSFSYTRSQNQAFGLSGFVNTQGFTIGVTHQPNSWINLAFSPGVFRNTQGDQELLAFRADVNANLNLAEWLSLQCNYRFNRQDGRFLSGTVSSSEEQEVSHNVFTIGLVFGYPLTN